MHDFTQKFRRTPLVVALLAAGLGLPAEAQNRSIEEVVVTAQKREERLQEGGDNHQANSNEDTREYAGKPKPQYRDFTGQAQDEQHIARRYQGADQAGAGDQAGQVSSSVADLLHFSPKHGAQHASFGECRTGHGSTGNLYERSVP